MPKSFSHIRPKEHRVYSVPQVISLYGIHRNTLSNWVHSGLRPSNDSGLQLFRGLELIRFHKERRERSRHRLRQGEFKCFRCKAAVFPALEGLCIEPAIKHAGMALASCPDCDAALHKLLNETECNMLRDALENNITLGISDEDSPHFLGGIVKNEEIESVDWHRCNDEVIHQWQIYARKWDGKTIDKYLAAIREFEHMIGGRPFQEVTQEDADCYRDFLIGKALLPKEQGGLSRSTVSKKAGQLAAFFAWLVKQPGYRRMNQMLPEYFELPRKALAKALELAPRAYPKFSEVPPMLAAMPCTTLQQRRDRAMVAFAFITGLRAAALTSLRLRHLNMERREVFHNGAELRAKNSKSFMVDWFPKTEALQPYFIDWVDELRALGFRPCDAVFPACGDLPEAGGEISVNHPEIVPMRSQAAVSQAFEVATGGRFTPHAARHTLKALGDAVCTTLELCTAWSRNLAHETLEITQRNYAQMTNETKRNLLTNFKHQTGFSAGDLELMLQYHNHQLHPGTTEFNHARKLDRRYKKQLPSEDDDDFEVVE